MHIFSDLKPDDPWKGYPGFITNEVLENEVNFKNKSTFFIIGPPVFIEKMTNLLKEFSIDEKQVKKELIK